MSIAAPLTMTPSTGCSLFNKYGLWYNKHPLSVMFVTRREKKGNRSDVKEYVYTVKRGLTIEPEDLKLSRKVFNHILSKHRKPSFQHINMNLDNNVAVITEKKTDKAKTFDYWLRLSTFEKGKAVYMPVQSNEYFDSIAGNRRKFCQVNLNAVSYTHLRAHETDSYLVCRLLLE